MGSNHNLTWARAIRYEKLAEEAFRRGDRRVARKYERMQLKEEKSLPKDFHVMKMRITRKNPHNKKWGEIGGPKSAKRKRWLKKIRKKR